MNKNCNGVRHDRATTRRLADHGDDVVVQAGGVEGVAQRRQGVEEARDGVDHRGVVVLPARLVFLGAVVVVDGVQHAAGLLGRGAEHHRRLAAVGADLDADAVAEVASPPRRRARGPRRRA